MKKSVFICWFVYSTYCSVLAQTNQQRFIDSLKNQVGRLKSDTNRIKTLDLISYTYSRFNYDEGIKYAREAEGLAVKLNWKRGIANANVNLGLNNVGKCDYTKAALHYTKALEIYRQLDDRPGQGSVYANLGLLYLAKSDYAKALDYDFKALAILEEIGDIHKRAIVLENIGTIYLEQRKHSETLKYYALALAEYIKIKDKDGISRNLGNQGIIFNEQGRYAEALDYHLRALKINQEAGNESSEQINLANAGITYGYLKNYPLALKFHLRALEVSKKLNDIRSVAINLGNTGELYFFMANDSLAKAPRSESLQKAIVYLAQAVETCKAINFAGPLVEFSQFLSQAYALSGDYKRALEMYKDYTVTKDSVFSQEARLKMVAIETKRQMDLKNKDIILKDRQIQIEQLQVVNRNNERVIFLVTIGLLFIIIFLLQRLFRLRSRTHKKILSDIANIQSHGVRAPLARILGLAQLFDQKDPSAPINKKVVNLMNQSALELDEVIKKTVDKASEQRPGAA